MMMINQIIQCNLLLDLMNKFKTIKILIIKIIINFKTKICPLKISIKVRITKILICTITVN
jgi:hypothetical protein